MNILYLEDEPNDARLVERYIHATPHQLIVVSNLDDASQALEANPDLILVDVLLNQARQGFTFVRTLRRQGYEQPVIAITGLTLPHDLEECYASGCNAVITKPYMINQLAEAINEYTT